MTNKPMLVINHIEPVGLIAESGSELAKRLATLISTKQQMKLLIKMKLKHCTLWVV